MKSKYAFSTSDLFCKHDSILLVTSSDCKSCLDLCTRIKKVHKMILLSFIYSALKKIIYSFVRVVAFIKQGKEENKREKKCIEIRK